jgi:SulP family sulfate permease
MNFCNKRGVTLVYSGLTAPLQEAFEQAKLTGKGKLHRAFATRNEALDWSEQQLLGEMRPADRGGEPADFAGWLAEELGCRVSPELIAYFERKEFRDGDTLYRQGQPADSIDFVAAGALAIMLEDEHGSARRLRRSTRRTVIGEMGFFRNVPRGATIAAEGPTLVYSLTRAGLARMQREHPRIYEAFLRFFVRKLSDRLELANREVAALM